MESNVGQGNVRRMRRSPEVERRMAQARYDKRTRIWRDGQLRTRTRREALLDRLRAARQKSNN